MSNKEFICKNITEQKTTVLIIEEKNQISSELIDSLKIKTFSENIKIYRSNGKHRIKNCDVYIIDSIRISIKNKTRLVKKIYKANPKAFVFMINETQENKNIISNEIESYIDITKMGNVIEKRSEEVNEIESIVNYLCSIEKIKQKLSSLWEKIELA